LSLYYKFTANAVGERIVKMGQYLAKLEAKILWHLSSGHGVEDTVKSSCLSEKLIRKYRH